MSSVLQPVVQSSVELLRMTGDDGIEYVVAPFEWSLEKAEKYYPWFQKFGIFSDDVPPNVEGFLGYTAAARTLWFEVTRSDTGENVGFMYLSDLMASWTDHRYLSASWHSIVWDAHAAYRRNVAREFIKVIFRLFRLHRLNASIPLKFGGVIRNAKKLGFKEEGVLRESRRYKGVWYGVLVLSILESELDNG